MIAGRAGKDGLPFLRRAGGRILGRAVEKASFEEVIARFALVAGSMLLRCSLQKTEWLRVD